MIAESADVETKCKKSVEHLKKELSHLRSGRASTTLFETISVDYYGSKVSLQQMGVLNVPEPRMVTIQVFDPSAVEAVEKAIQASELGLNPSRDGNLLRIIIPQLTEERRKDLVKKAHKMAEEARISMRTHRRDANEILKKKQKSGDISEDESRRAQDEIQKICDRHSKDVDVALAAKEKEMMEV